MRRGILIVLALCCLAAAPAGLTFQWFGFKQAPYECYHDNDSGQWLWTGRMNPGDSVTQTIPFCGITQGYCHDTGCSGSWPEGMKVEFQASAPISGEIIKASGERLTATASKVDNQTYQGSFCVNPLDIWPNACGGGGAGVTCGGIWTVTFNYPADAKQAARSVGLSILVQTVPDGISGWCP